VFNLHDAQKSVVFCCMPGHTSLPGNEPAEEVTLLMNLTSDQALGGDVHAFPVCAVVFS
jgi:hypothetical protein